MGLTLHQFEEALAACGDFSAQERLAVGVSGGPDSMALASLLSAYAQKHGKEIFVYTVDHGLRAQAAQEAALVSRLLSAWPNTHHKILRWEGEKPQTRLLEEARKARYNLLFEAAREDGCKSLFIAHHQDDQAETFLIRLAKGSGLDGLCGMRPMQPMEGGILVRPLLGFSKEELIQTCRENNIEFVDDPTNSNETYTRPRLRAVKKALEEEGMTSKRLATTATRLLRARQALEAMSDDLFKDALLESGEEGYVFDWLKLKSAPEELSLRVVLRSIELLCPHEDYGPRMERVENLLGRILHDDGFKGATLSGCAFTKNVKQNHLKIERE